MSKWSIPFAFMAALLLVLPALAQDDATGGDGPQSTVTIFFVACENQAVMNLTGVMQPGFDVYYQVFSGPGGSGNALTAQRRVQVNGDFAFSEQIAYNNGATVAAGAVASARVVIAREGNPSSTTFETTVDDIQDGCANPQNPVGTSDDAGSGGTGSDASSSIGQIRSPFGGFINNNLNAAPEPLVVIGARRPDLGGLYRSDTPGVLFAECDQYLPEAQPGLLYTSDDIVIFWSWYARTAEQVEAHLANAIYEVTLNRAPLMPVQVSPIEQRGVNFWAFYTVPIGSLTPGTYGVEFGLRWENEITDGYERFGPGTANESFNSSCTFTINLDSFSEPRPYNQMYSLR
jgi:hypothetical protein